MSYLLRIYKAPSGQWSGIVFEDGQDVARIAGCESPGEVEDTAHDQFPGIEVEDTPEAKAFWASFDGQPNTDDDEPRTTDAWLDRGVDGINAIARGDKPPPRTF